MDVSLSDTIIGTGKERNILLVDLKQKKLECLMHCFEPAVPGFIVPGFVATRFIVPGFIGFLHIAVLVSTRICRIFIYFCD